jgi:hypothetical protein
MNAQSHAMRYSVIRVVPDPIRDEPVNVGILLHDLSGGGVRVRVLRDVQKLRTYTSEDLDTASLEFALTAIADIGGSTDDRKDFVERIAGQFTHLLQLTPPAGSLAADPAAELDDLYDRFVSLETRGRRGKSAGLTRRSLVSRVRSALESTDVKVEMRRRFQGILGSFVFDFVRDGEQLASLQCLSLAGDLDESAEAAKALAYSVRDIRNRGAHTAERRVERLHLTSLVAPPIEENGSTESIRAILADVGEVRDSEREFQKALSNFAGL